MIIQGDCLEKLKELGDNSIDSIVSDPPYELGFMGKSWDNTGIAYNVEMWKECLRVLKPGGYLLSFGGSRTYHRMTCAIEDAGFEIRDMIEWIYGQGFPKSHNVGKAYDKLMGNNREVVGIDKTTAPDLRDVGAMSKESCGIDKLSFGQNPRPAERKQNEITKGTSEYEGWGSALKPAHEPICMARKPLSEKTIVQNVIKWGTGAINIDGCRVEVGKDDPNHCAPSVPYKNGIALPTGNSKGRPVENLNMLGRFPANFLHDGSPEVTSLFPETKSGKMGSQHTRHTDGSPNGIYGKFDINHPLSETYGDSGSAARFFYCAKASKSERNNGLDGFEEKQTVGGGGMNNTEDDVCGKYGSIKAKSKNSHPTIKPIKLMRYLCRLVTPKGGTVLDPFMGSGSTGISAKLENFDFIGIELDKEYCKIAEARINNFKL